MKKRVLCVKLVPSVKVASHLHALGCGDLLAVFFPQLKRTRFSPVFSSFFNYSAIAPVV